MHRRRDDEDNSLSFANQSTYHQFENLDHPTSDAKTHRQAIHLPGEGKVVFDRRFAAASDPLHHILQLVFDEKEALYSWQFRAKIIFLVWTKVRLSIRFGEIGKEPFGPLVETILRQPVYNEASIVVECTSTQQTTGIRAPEVESSTNNDESVKSVAFQKAMTCETSWANELE